MYITSSVNSEQNRIGRHLHIAYRYITTLQYNKSNDDKRTIIWCEYWIQDLYMFCEVNHQMHKQMQKKTKIVRALSDYYTSGRAAGRLEEAREADSRWTGSSRSKGSSRSPAYSACRRPPENRTPPEQRSLSHRGRGRRPLRTRARPIRATCAAGRWERRLSTSLQSSTNDSQFDQITTRLVSMQNAKFK